MTGDITQDPREDRSMFEKRKRANQQVRVNRPKAKPKAIHDHPREVIAISDSESNPDIDENLDVKIDYYVLFVPLESCTSLCWS